MINTQEIQKWFLSERTNEEKASHARNVTITQVVSIIFSILTIVCASVWLGYNTHYAIWQVLISGIISLIVGLLLINWARTARRLFLSTPDADVQNANLRNTFTAFAATVIAAVATLGSSLFVIYYRCWYKFYQASNTDWQTVDNLFPILTATLFIQFILFTYAAYATYIAAPGERTIRRLLALSNALLGILGIVVIYYTLYASRYLSLNLINNIVSQALINKLYWIAFIAVIASIIAIIFILRRWRTAYLIYAVLLAGLLLFGATWIGLYHRQLRHECGDYSSNCAANLQTVSADYLTNNGCSAKYNTDPTACNSNQKALMWENDVGKTSGSRSNKKGCLNMNCCQPLTSSILDPFVKLAVWGFLFTLVLALSSGAGFVLAVLPSDESVAGRVWEYVCFAIQLIFIIVYFFLALFGLPAVPQTNTTGTVAVNAAASLGALKLAMATDLGYAINPLMNIRAAASTSILPVPQQDVGENACYPVPSVTFPTDCDGGDCTKAVSRIALYSTGNWQIDSSWTQGDVVLLDENVGQALLSKKTPEATVDTVRTAQMGSYFTAEGPQSQLKDLVGKYVRFCPLPFRVQQAAKLRVSIESDVDCDESDVDCEEYEVCDEAADSFADCCAEFPTDENCLAQESLRKVGDDLPIVSTTIVFGANSVTAANRPKAIVPIATDKTKATQESYAALSLQLNTADQYTVRGLLVIPKYYAETSTQSTTNPDKTLEGKPTFDWAADLETLTLIQPDPAGKAAPKIDETRLDFCVTRRPGFIQDALQFPLGEAPAGLQTCSVADEVTRVPKQALKELTSYEFNFKVNQMPQGLPYTVLLRVLYKNTKTNKAGPYFYQKAYLNFTVGGYPKVTEQNLGVIVLNPNVTFPYTDDNIPTGRRAARVAGHIKNVRASVDYPKVGTIAFPQPFSRITVNVVNASSNTPIPNALVELYSSTNQLITRFPETSVSNRTNGQGSLILPNTTQQAYLVRVTAQGFHSSAKIINAHYSRYAVTFALSPLVTDNSQLRVVLEWKTAVLDLDLFVTFNAGTSGEAQCEVSQYQKSCVGANFEAGNYVGGHNGSETILISTIGKYDYLFFVQSAPQTNDDIFKQSRYSRVAELNNPTKNITLSGAQVRVYTPANGGATYQFEVPAGKSLYYDISGDGLATPYSFTPKAGYPKASTNDKLVDESALTWLAFCMRGDVGPRSIIPLNSYWNGQTADITTPDASICTTAYASTAGNTW